MRLKDEILKVIDFIEGKTPEGKKFFEEFTKKREGVTSLNRKTFWFNREEREKKNIEDIHAINQELNNDASLLYRKVDDIVDERSKIYTKIVYGEEQSIPYSPVDKENSGKMKKVKFGSRYPDSRIYYSDKKRESKIINAVMKLEKLATEFQRELDPLTEKARDLIREKFKV